jgi:hypothetical protein
MHDVISNMIKVVTHQVALRLWSILLLHLHAGTSPKVNELALVAKACL